VAEYEITFARPASKELEALPASIVSRIFQRLKRSRMIRDRVARKNCADLSRSGEFA